MFNNIAPRSRQERLAMRDKERIEQKRIQERCEGFQRNTDPFALAKPDPHSDYFIPEESRFDKDFAVHDKIVREQEYLKKLQVYEAKRQAQFERDNQRWEAMDEALRSEKAKIEKKAVIALSNKRNKNRQVWLRISNPYNPLTLEYENSKEGEVLKERDMAAKDRAYKRGENIYTKGNSSWNPLTGQALPYHYQTGKAEPAGAPTVPTYSRPF